MAISRGMDDNHMIDHSKVFGMPTSYVRQSMSYASKTNFASPDKNPDLNWLSPFPDVNMNSSTDLLTGP